jgi:hypothetical protein
VSSSLLCVIEPWTALRQVKDQPDLEGRQGECEPDLALSCRCDSGPGGEFIDVTDGPRCIVGIVVPDLGGAQDNMAPSGGRRSNLLRF